MSEDTTTAAAPSTPAAKRKRPYDRWVKFGFLILAIGFTVFLWKRQTVVPDMPGEWRRGGLEAAMQEAGEQRRSVVLFVTRSTPSQTASRIIKEVLPKPASRQALTDHNVIPVHEVASLANADLLKRYEAGDPPALLLIGPTGWVYNRYAGNIGEVEFAHGFLDCSKIKQPGLAGWDTDVDAALNRARDQKRPVLLYFTHAPLEPATQQGLAALLGDASIRADLEARNYVLIHVPVPDLKTWAGGTIWGIRSLPTLLALDPRGRKVATVERPLDAKTYLNDVAGR